MINWSWLILQASCDTKKVEIHSANQETAENILIIILYNNKSKWNEFLNVIKLHYTITFLMK